MMKYLYLSLDLGSFIIPFLYSFHPKMAFYKQFKAFFLSIAIVAFVFLVWDEFFTQIGVWGFNPEYLTGIYLGHLPLEEVLFFFCIPFSSLFIHYSLAYFKPKWLIGDRTVMRISIFLFLSVLVAVIYNFPAKYTTFNGVFFLVLMIWSLFKPNNELNRFYLSFLIILVPFFLVNGILTGSFIEDPVVWYNNSENLGLRLGTIPVEDVFYAFNMLYPTLMMTKYFSKKFNL
ncbi:MAG: lycopene cyclase domain-containing protein [Flavobacteriaceae bacterium]